MDKDSVRLRKLGIPWGSEHIDAVKMASLKLPEVRIVPLRTFRRPCRARDDISYSDSLARHCFYTVRRIHILPAANFQYEGSNFIFPRIKTGCNNRSKTSV